MEKKLLDSEIRDLWQRRAEGVKERRLLEEQLAEVSQEISLLDRLLFFRTSENEVAEKRIKERLADLREMLRETGVAIEEFWDKLGRELPEVRRVRDLEEALRRSLVARTAGEVKSALEACRRLVEQALKELSIRLPSGEVSPERALAELFAGSELSFLRPLSALTSLLELAKPISEATWEGSRTTLDTRPVLISLVGQVMERFAQAEPEYPFPSELVCGWLEKDHPGARLPVIPDMMEEIYAAGESRKAFAELEKMLEEMAGHDLALRVTRREISWFDRAVFWSDTPAEARERSLMSDRGALAEEIGSRWLEFDRELRSRRRESWEIYRCDQALAVRDGIRAISTPSGESSRAKDCPLLNQEQAIWQVAQFANEVGQRFGVVPTRQLLLEEALGSSEAEEFADDGAEMELVAMERLGRRIGPLLMNQGFPRRYENLLELRKRAESDKETLRDVRGQISTWDRVNVFKDTAEEAREKELAEAITRDLGVAEELQLEVESEFETLLATEHPPALVGLLLGELAMAVDAVRAECASYTRSYEDSEGETHYETVYYCVLRGIEAAGALLKRLLSSIVPEPGAYLAPSEAAEAWALLESSRAPAIRILEMSVDD